MKRKFHRLATSLLILVAGIFSSPLGAQTGLPDHGPWDALLKKHVAANGRVNYRGFLADRETLGHYIGTLEEAAPQPGWSSETTLAYYINLYNAVTVRLILDNLPLGSIRDINRPWDQKLVVIGGKSISLNNIEHDILRKMDEPRIHFAINCASVSCPALQPFAYTAEVLDQQLDAVARQFINDPAHNRSGPERLELSRIFKWYQKDFTGESGGLEAYIGRYLEQPVPKGTRLQFLPYDWNLNAAR